MLRRYWDWCHLASSRLRHRWYSSAIQRDCEEQLQFVSMSITKDKSPACRHLWPAHVVREDIQCKKSAKDEDQSRVVGLQLLSVCQGILDQTLRIS